MLGLQAETAVLGIVITAMAALRSIQPIAGIHLNTRLCGPYLHHPSGSPLVDRGASLESLPLALEDEVVVIANGLSGQSSEVPTDWLSPSKVERCTNYWDQLAGGNRGGIHWGVGVRGELQLVAENVPAAGEIEITMVGQIDRCGTVSGSGVINP